MKETDIVQLTELLRLLKPGFLPYDIFVEIARLTVLPIIEFVPLRIVDDEVEVLLLSRDTDDPIWPNELHTPGTVIRATDIYADIYLAFSRIIKDELDDTVISNPHYVGSSLHESKRGVEQAQIFWVEVLGEPKTGTFYKMSMLPERLMKSQEGFIKQSARSFKEVRQVKK